MGFTLPGILVDIPRNPVLAVGIPIALGTLSGFPTRKESGGVWYKVCSTVFLQTKYVLTENRTGRRYHIPQDVLLVKPSQSYGQRCMRLWVGHPILL